MPAAGPPYAYGFQNQVRDVTTELHMVIKQQPTLLSILSVSSKKARNHKHEWPERTSAPESTTLATAVDNAATTFVVEDKSPFEPNAIFRVEGSREVLRVVAVDDTDEEITVARGYGGSTAAAIAIGARLVIVSKPKNESSAADNDYDGQGPTIEYNYTEIFEGKASVSKSQTAIHGVGDPGTEDPVGDMLDYFLEEEMRQMGNRGNSSIIWGRRMVRASKTVPGTMGGLLQFHEGGNLVNAGGVAINERLLGEAFQKCFDGGAGKLDTLLCGAEQALNLSQLYKDRLRVAREDTTAGTVIYQVQAGLPIAGYITTIVVDPTFPKDAISIFAKDRIKIVYLRPVTDEDARPPAADFVARRMIGEWTVEFHNWKQTACLIDNLSTERL